MPQVNLGPIKIQRLGATMEQATYRVLARSWRPQTFDELVGQGHVARTVTNAIESQRLAHAYLFAGVRGTGKTTVARILAKCLNCTKGPTTRPCGECDPCREIAAGNSLDVLELDAASRTKVDQTREMLEMVSYAPVRDRYKVFIIDEAHMLSKQSFAALLKTIEEPPPRVIFILATTELQKILPTILSRCQVFEFRRVGVADLTAHLRRIADAEALTITDASLDRLARAGEGSVRDSLSLLERVIAFCGREVADDDVLRLLGAVRIDVLATFVRALAARDAPGMLALLDAVAAEGHDLTHFWTELIGALRDLLLLRTLPDRADLLGRAAGEAELLAEASEGLTRDDITRAFTLLADIEGALRTSTQPRYIFEATLIRLAALGAVRPIEEILAGLGGELPRPAQPAQAPPPGPTTTSRRAAAAPPLEKKKADRIVAPDADPKAVIAAIAEMPPMLGALLREADISLESDAVRVAFPTGMVALQRQLERADNLETLSRLVSEAYGRTLTVRAETVTMPAAPQRAATTEAATPEISATPTRAPEQATSEALLSAAQAEPGVRELLDVFGARVVDIRPLALNPPDTPETDVPHPGEETR